MNNVFPELAAARLGRNCKTRIAMYSHQDGGCVLLRLPSSRIIYAQRRDQLVAERSKKHMCTRMHLMHRCVYDQSVWIAIDLHRVLHLSLLSLCVQTRQVQLYICVESGGLNCQQVTQVYYWPPPPPPQLTASHPHRCIQPAISLCPENQSHTLPPNKIECQNESQKSAPHQN